MTDSSSIARTLRGLSGPRRVMLFGATAAAIAAVWLVAWWASAPTYVTLFSDLEFNDAAGIEEKLEKNDIPHRLAAGGTEVQVPVADVARARVALAKEGVAAYGRPGLELFDKPSWGMTDFTQRVTYQRALEGELARTIGGLRGIQRAQVHLVTPAPSPLRKLERPASASVVLTLKPGVTLAPDVVQGITYIVSNSVEQLSSDNVAVMDDAGHVLSIPSSGGSAAGMTTRQLDIQHSVERHLVDKIESLLATVVGLGRARAQVSALLSFEQVDRTIDAFDPDGQVLQSEQRSESGAGPDDPGSQTIVSNAYLNSRRLEKIIGSVGNLSRLTVAVLVDEAALQGAGAAGRERVDVTRLEAMVRDAIGIDDSRGDRISVMSVPFEPAPVAVAAPGAGSAGSAEPGADPLQIAERFSRPLVGIVATIVLLLLAWRVLALGPARAPAAPAAGGPEVAPAKAQAGPNVAEIVPFPNRAQAEPADRPDTTAQVMRAWLAESS